MNATDFYRKLNTENKIKDFGGYGDFTPDQMIWFAEEYAKQLAIPIEPPVMQWRTRDEKPIPSKRIIIFSPCYPEESDMRKRIITGQFLGLCTEATHWSYIGEPSA